MSISVLILTFNEEKNLPSCLESLSWSDDIVVLDSYSTDRTSEIARQANARVYQRTFDCERNQRAYGLNEIEFKHSWVYISDADEVVTPELRDEMLAISVDQDRREVAFRVRYKNIFMGRWIRHSSLYPTWLVRLVRPQSVCVEREFHSSCVANGPEGRLQNHFLHFSFNKGLNAWYEKHNVYSSSEAQAALQSLKSKELDWSGAFNFSDPVRRRKALKELSLRLPFRSGFRFFYMYLIRGGFLDGSAGYMYCRLIAAYEYMIVTKMAEIRRREGGLPV
jgi:glycosyltransferase involved in cell wall biosynthesis